MYDLDSPRHTYPANSFTEYTLPGEERRKKRGAAQEPSDLLDRFSNHITMQIRLDPGVTDAIFFYAVSEDGMEYSKLGVGKYIGIYSLAICCEVYVLKELQI